MKLRWSAGNFWAGSLVLLLALTCGFAPKAAAQDGMATGQILDVAGKPWVDIAIQAVSDQGAKADTKTDRDGNDLAGVRLPEVQVPLATYTGWAVRAAPQENDGCEGSGQYIPFTRTKAERLLSGDPRLSIEERYADVETYSSLLRNAIDKLERAGFLLPPEAKAMLQKNLTNAGSRGLVSKSVPATASYH